MPIQKVQIKPGVNREITAYASEGGWYESEKVRFRQEYPEKIGGWARISTSTFIGVCRSLWNWVTLGSLGLTALGTHLKYYLENGGTYYDITPIRATVTLTNPFVVVSGSAVVTVTDTNGSYIDGDYVTFSGASAVGGITINGEYVLAYASGSTYTITHTSNATSTTSGGGTVTAAYQVNIGPSVAVPLVGWGAGGWGSELWGTGGTSTEAMRLWTQHHFGEDLIFGPMGGAMYYWDATNAVTTRGVALSGLTGASDVPTSQNYILVSDINRFVFAFGANTISTATVDPMLVRWSDQESAVNWTPAATNQAGSLKLSRGAKIVTARQARQEILVWTDSSLYAFQYVGAPIVWGAQLVGENISTASPRAVAYANGTAYWMGKDKFYSYSGTTVNLRCDLRKYIFDDFNFLQYAQVFAGTIEAFTEVWWFYCSANSTTIDRYVVYNYGQDIWYYGTLARTAWLDSGLRQYPLAATYTFNLVNHEEGLDDNETGTTAAISAHILSSEFDIGDGDRFSFIKKVLPDMSFSGSTASSPAAVLTLLPLAGSGSGYNSPASEGGTDTGTVTRSATSPIEAYTNQLDMRVRGRQLSIKVSSTAEGVAWRLGVPRLDIRPDGRR